MFKRFTDCHKWQDPWFRSLPIEYKLFWLYICDMCDNSGVWRVDWETASYFIHAEIDSTKAMELFKERLYILSPGHFLVKKFIDFQFGELTGESPLHKSVLKLVAKHSLALPYPKPSARVQVKVKVKEEVKVKDVEVKRFGIPKAEEVADYAKSIGFKLDGEKFMDYYTSRGWKIGHSAIKDWKACVRTWKSKQSENALTLPVKQPTFAYDEHIPNEEDLMTADDIAKLRQSLKGTQK